MSRPDYNISEDDGTTTPQQRLVMAVISLCVEDACHEPRQSGIKGKTQADKDRAARERRLRQDKARLLIMESYTFEHMCWLVGIDPDNLRRLLSENHDWAKHWDFLRELIPAAHWRAALRMDDPALDKGVRLKSVKSHAS